MDGHDCGGDGWGFGWFFPALLIGRLIADAFDRPAAPAPSAWPTAPAAPAAQPVQAASVPAHQPAPAPTAGLAAVTCQHCASVVNRQFNFCPSCGYKLAPASCRYCGQGLRPEMSFCAHCGAPRR